MNYSFKPLSCEVTSSAIAKWRTLAWMCFVTLSCLALLDSRPTVILQAHDISASL